MCTKKLQYFNHKNFVKYPVLDILTMLHEMTHFALERRLFSALGTL